MIAVINYKAGNIRSVVNALNRLNCESIVTEDLEVIVKADKVILPGVGEAATAMHDLKRSGVAMLLPRLTQPVLGICLGLQLMCRSSEEGSTEGLGIFNTNVKRFPPKDLVPQIGWNNFSLLSGKLFKGIDLHEDVYFVHSYYADLCAQTAAVSEYILPFSSGLEKDNFFATQFHPEKSAEVGQRILTNFLDL